MVNCNEQVKSKPWSMNFRFFLILLPFLISGNMTAQVNTDIQIISLQFAENDNFPNNQKLPVLVYKNVFEFGNTNPAVLIERIFESNNWGGSWRNGIYDVQHFHTTAHEALGVYGGWAEVQLGGPGNKTMRIEAGDLVILPAGTTHKKINSGNGFAVVGAYPDGQNWDMKYGQAEELEFAKKNIANVSIPTNDPVFGNKGKLFDYWK